MRVRLAVRFEEEEAAFAVADRRSPYPFAAQIGKSFLERLFAGIRAQVLPVRQEQFDRGENGIHILPLQPSSFQIVEAPGEIKGKSWSLAVGTESRHTMQ